jgi:phosphate starvation-inducible membrane PsiE
MKINNESITKIGHLMVDSFHYIALFVIGGTIVWSAAYEYINMMSDGYAKLKDILLLFIYLELGAMVGIYFKTHKLPVQFLIYIAITALARHLVVDLKDISILDQLYLMLGISSAILLLTFAIIGMAYANKRLSIEVEGQDG